MTTDDKNSDLPKLKNIKASAFAEFRQYLKIKAELEPKIKAQARAEIYKKYPSIEAVSKCDRDRIESSWRAKLYWESGIPRLRSRSEEIWQSQLGEDW